MKKLFICFLMLGLLFSSMANAATKLKGKTQNEIYQHIAFVDGTGEKEHVLGNVIKVTTLAPIGGYSALLGIEPYYHPEKRVYYFRAKNFFMTVDHVFGVKGIELQLENLTDNAIVIDWNNSTIQIGESDGIDGIIVNNSLLKFGLAKSIPLVDNPYFTDEGQPIGSNDTIIPPKATIKVNLYSSQNRVRLDRNSKWVECIVPMSDEGTTKATITMKIAENGVGHDYTFNTPCFDFPADYVAANKDDMKK